jgi:hypothetical protein
MEANIEISDDYGGKISFSYFSIPDFIQVSLTLFRLQTFSALTCQLGYA